MAMGELMPAAPDTDFGLLPWPRWLLLFAFLVAFTALDRAIVAGQPEPAIPAWDLAGGLAFCLLALEGPLWAPAVLMVDLATQGLHPQPHNWPQLITESLLFTLTTTAAAIYLRRSGGLRLDHQSDLLRLVSVTGIAGFLQATAALAWRTLAHPGLPALIDTFAEYWIGMLLGVALIAPLVLSAPRFSVRLSRRTWIEAVAQAALLLAVLSLVYPPPEGDRFRYFYLLFVPQIWISVRFAVPGAALANLAIQIWMIVFAALRPDDVGLLVNYKFRVLALTVSGLFLAVAVAERRQVERALFERQEQLARVARLSLAGEMAAALAHQLNQPLAAAMAFAHAAKRRLDGREPANSPLMLAMDGAVGEVERAGGIVRTLRSFVGRAEPNKAVVSLEAVVTDALALAEPECVREGIRLAWTPERPIPRVALNVIEVQQVVLNLVQNAVDALKGASGTRAITVSARRNADGKAEVEVRDTGAGVPGDLVDRLFEPFTSTKPSGMGLGLLISRGIIESHGGRIWLAENARGACAFRFTLPAGPREPLETP
jgi:signal transduction histidine kinase